MVYFPKDALIKLNKTKTKQKKKEKKKVSIASCPFEQAEDTGICFYSVLHPGWLAELECKLKLAAGMASVTLLQKMLSG